MQRYGIPWHPCRQRVMTPVAAWLRRLFRFPLRLCTILHGKLKRVEEEVLGKAYDSRLMRRLLGYMRPYRGYVALSLVFLLLQSILQVLGHLPHQIAIKPLSRRPTPPAYPHASSSPYLPPPPWNGLAAVGMMYLGVLLGTFIFEFVQVYLMHCRQEQSFHVRFAQAARWLTCRTGRSLRFDRNPVGRLITRVTTDVDVLNDLFDTPARRSPFSATCWCWASSWYYRVQTPAQA